MKRVQMLTAAIALMIGASSAMAGSVGSGLSGRTVVDSRSVDQFSVVFRGGERAMVSISGDGDSRLDLYVYDENGNRVCAQVGPGDDATCSWRPTWTGAFKIRVVNRGVANEYRIQTN